MSRYRRISKSIIILLLIPLFTLSQIILPAFSVPIPNLPQDTITFLLFQKIKRKRKPADNAVNRVIQVTDPFGKTNQTQYLDGQTKIIITDKRGIQRTQQWDALGRLVSLTETGTDTTTVKPFSRQYDPNGNLVQVTDAVGNLTTMGISHQRYQNSHRFFEKTRIANVLQDLPTSKNDLIDETKIEELGL